MGGWISEKKKVVGHGGWWDLTTIYLALSLIWKIYLLSGFRKDYLLV